MERDVIVVSSQRIGEEYYKINHKSGLEIIIYPKPNFQTTYAMFSTRYGSIDVSFMTNKDDKVHKVPAGIAHFLEHKLFESEDGDAFERYAKTGADANAYTDFENTCYLFSTTGNAYEALEILLDFVQSPYFTKEGVEKERGIIEQEIKMYEDDPQWRVMFNLLRNMYHNHPVKEDIAGTVESIADITPEYLYRCYNTFYNLHNMSLVISGKVDVERVLILCDKMLKPCEKLEVIRHFEDEPETVLNSYVEEKLEVALPLFEVGYKEKFESEFLDEKSVALAEIILDVVASTSSPLFKKLYDLELINDSSFGYEYLEGDGFATTIFVGESKDPKRVRELIDEEIDKLKENGLLEEDFNRAKKSIYGSNISGLNSASNISNAITSLNFKKRELYAYIDVFSKITLEDANEKLLKMMDKNRSVLSVILPTDEN